MGIDIYAEWDGRTEEELHAQETAPFSVTAGHVGYLREAYHGEPYATRHLVREAFEAENQRAQIPAAVLRRRLPATLALARQRVQLVYPGRPSAGILKSYEDFVALVERKERETGNAVTIFASY